MVPGESDRDELNIARLRWWRYADVIVEELRRHFDLMAFMGLDCIPQNRVSTLIVNQSIGRVASVRHQFQLNCAGKKDNAHLNVFAALGDISIA
jgi:hypothetical protein